MRMPSVDVHPGRLNLVEGRPVVGMNIYELTMPRLSLVATMKPHVKDSVESVMMMLAIRRRPATTSPHLLLALRYLLVVALRRENDWRTH